MVCPGGPQVPAAELGFGAPNAGIAMANIMAAITNATTTNEMMRFIISATSLSLATPAGLLLPSIEAGGDEFPMNFVPFRAIFLANFREFLFYVLR
jgi:hypothetical protein